MIEVLLEIKTFKFKIINYCKDQMLLIQNNHKIYKYGNDGIVTLIGGSTQGYLDASGASQAKFNQPTDIVFGPEGYLYVVDSGNNAIRIIRPDGNIYTFINTGLLNPQGITIDESNTLYLTDTGNNRVCNITIGGILTTMVGYSDYTSGFSDGQGNLASFNGPTGIVIDKQSNLYVVDTGNNAIRRITPAGIVTTVVENVYEYKQKHKSDNIIWTAAASMGEYPDSLRK
jgi:sugar lactone lactonase YvrE